MTPGSTTEAARDSAIMRALSHGLLAPTAELWLFRSTPLDRSDLADKLRMSERLARYFPSYVVITRRAIFLAFNGQATEARSLLAQGMQSHPQSCAAITMILQEALATDRDAIEPLLALAKSASRPNCI